MECMGNVLGMLGISEIFKLHNFEVFCPLRSGGGKAIAGQVRQGRGGGKFPDKVSYVSSMDIS